LWIAAIIYYVLLEGLFGRTLGKAAVGIRVTGLDGQRPSRRQILVRNLLRPIDWLPAGYFLGALVARLTGGRQRIGDHLARTVVVRESAVVGSWPTAEERRRGHQLVAGILAAFLVACGAFSYFGRPEIALANAAGTGRFPGGLVSSLRHGRAQWHGGSVTYPVTYNRAASGASCSGTITLDWHGLLESWQMSSAESSC
jgi:hypothetical protein